MIVIVWYHHARAGQRRTINHFAIAKRQLLLTQMRNSMFRSFSVEKDRRIRILDRTGYLVLQHAFILICISLWSACAI